MLTLRSGFLLNMRTGTSFGRAFDDAVGSVSSIQSATSSRIIATTDTGATVQLNGDFDLSSASALRNSDLTGMFVRKNGALLFSLSGFGRVSFGDLENPAVINRLARSADDGVQIIASPFDDTLIGGRGNDRLLGRAGDDRISASAGDDRLYGHGGNDFLNGGSGRDVLIGSAGDDRLNGHLDRDIMRGGSGNDMYWVSQANDVVRDGGVGNDLVRSSVDYRLPILIEDLQLLGRAHLRATGTADDNILTGNSGNNRIRALAGDDVIDGGRGSDQMYGHAGDDTFFVDRVGDRVFETGNGNDTIWSKASYTLPANVENLLLHGNADINGRGNSEHNVIAGTNGSNSLSGLDGDDWLFGGSGIDSLTGGSGSDHFVFDTLDGHADLIPDFESGVDTIHLDTAVFTRFDGSPFSAANFRLIGDAADGNDYLVYDQADGLLYYDQAGNGGPLTAVADVGDGVPLTAADILSGDDLLISQLPGGGAVEIRTDTAWTSGRVWLPTSDGGELDIINII